MRKYFSLATKFASALLGTAALVTEVDVSQAQQTASMLECRTTGMSLAEEAQCACEAALRENTIEALENFIVQYGKADSACAALAQAALTQFAPNNNDGDHDGGNRPPDTGPYGG